MLKYRWGYKDIYMMLISFPLDIYSEIGLLDHTVVLFLIFWRKHRTVFHDGCISSHSHQQCTIVLFPLYPQQQLSFNFLMIAILTVVRIYITVFLCISLKITGIDNVFIYYLAIFMYSLEICVVRAFDYF
jgi:hypothetical protein